MEEIKKIREKYYEEGDSISKIAREEKRDRKTIRELITKENWNIQKLLQQDPQSWINTSLKLMNG